MISSSLWKSRGREREDSPVEDLLLFLRSDAMMLEKEVQEGRLRQGRKEEKSATSGVGEDESECGE